MTLPTPVALPNIDQVDKLLGARCSIVLTRRFKATHGNRILSQKVELRRMSDKRDIEAILKDHDGSISKVHLCVADGTGHFPDPSWPDDTQSQRVGMNYVWGVITDLLH